MTFCDRKIKYKNQFKKKQTTTKSPKIPSKTSLLIRQQLIQLDWRDLVITH